MALAFLRRQRWWLKWFLAAVIVSFIILYIPAFIGRDVGAPGETLAQVGSLAISVGEFQRAYFQQRQRLEQIYQGRLDPALLRRMRLEEQVLEGLVSDRLVLLEARRLGLVVGDEELAGVIARMPGLQENGRFVGAAEYQRRLELQGRSVEEFEEAVSRDLLRQKLEALVTDGLGVTPAEVEREFRRRTEQIKAEYVVVDAKPLRSQVTVEETDVRARFEAKKEVYRVPERRVLAYALLDAEALQARVPVTDRESEAYYQEHKDDYRQQEQVCGSHILVKVKGAGASEGHADEEAKRIAQGLLEQLRGGADFAALARKASEDKGSADGGGSLGCFPRGAMKPEFENAAFSLAKGETSELVKTDYGYHIIRVAEHREEGLLPLSQVKEQIQRALVAERAQASVEEKVHAVSDMLRHGRKLEDAARAQGLTVQKSGPLARRDAADPGALARAAGPLASPALVARAFEMKVGETDAEGFPVPRGHAFVALAEVQPPRVPDLKEVRDNVRADLEQEKSLAKARSIAEELKARAETDGLDKAAKALRLVRKESPGLVSRGQPLGDVPSGVALEEAAFALPEQALSDPVRAGDGYAVLRVLEKKPFDPAGFEKQKAAIALSVRQEKKDKLFQAYMSQARQRFPVERRLEAMRRVVR